MKNFKCFYNKIATALFWDNKCHRTLCEHSSTSYMNVPRQAQPTIPWPLPLSQPLPVSGFGALGWRHAEGGMFWTHSFSQDPLAQTNSLANQINWGYDPWSYLEKPLMRINHITFDGISHSCSFEEFKATLVVVCGGHNMPESQKLVCLKQLLAGDPLKIFNNIVGFDFLPGSLERVLCTLEDHFGGPQRIVNSYINRLTQYAPIRRFDCNSLLDLITIVEEIYNRY